MDPFLPSQDNRFMRLKFIDTMKFMAKLLQALMENFPKDKFKHVSKHFQGEESDLLHRKGVFPL